VTSADVEFSFELWEKAKTNSFMGRIASTEAPDPRTFVVNLKEPFPTFLLNLGSDDNVVEIQPKHVLEGAKDLAKTSQNADPVSSGPWVLDKWAKGDNIQLKPNPDYYRKGRPCLDSLVFKYLPDANARKIAFESGEVDLLIPYSIPLNNLDAYKQNARYQVVEGGLGSAPTDMLIFNVKTPELADAKVRQAIAYALDREAYNNLAYFGQAKVAHSSVNSTLTDYYDDSFDAYALPNLDKAEQLLDDAGFEADGDGKRFSLTLRYPASRPYEVSGAAVIKSQLAKVGIEVELRPGDQTSVNDLVFVKHDFDLSLQLRTTGPDPGVFAPLLYGKQGIGGVGFNGGSYSSPELEAAFKRLSTASESGEIKQIWSDIQRITMEDLPRLPLVEYPNVTLAQAGYENPVVGALSYFGQYATTSVSR
jgi:peptide/nickel transport system substrate-binding protein